MDRYRLVINDRERLECEDITRDSSRQKLLELCHALNLFLANSSNGEIYVEVIDDNTGICTQYGDCNCGKLEDDGHDVTEGCKE